jgi:hypothetical protein
MKFFQLNKTNVSALVAILLGAVIAMEASSLNNEGFGDKKSRIELASNDTSIESASADLNDYRKLASFSLLPAMAITALRRATQK